MMPTFSDGLLNYWKSAYVGKEQDRPRKANRVGPSEGGIRCGQNTWYVV